MHARFVTFTAAVLLASGAISAEPNKPPAPHAKPTQTRSTPVVLAAAEQLASDSTPEAAPPPAKRRVGRVTTCRCGGDSQPQPPQEQ